MNRVMPQGTERKYQPYPAYKDTGVEWLGEIPAHWEVNRLKWGVSLINDKIENGETATSYLGLENVESWTGRIVESDFRPEQEGASNCFRRDDVLFGKLRPYLAKAVHAQYHGICTSEFMVLRPRKYYSRYLFYHMLSGSTVNIVDSSTYGVKMPRANWQFIGCLPAPLPPLGEQQGIAEFLDHETARIDELIARKQRLIELLQEQRVALITRTVTKGLNPEIPMKYSGVEWLGEIPAHWEVKKLSWIFEVKGRIGWRGYTAQDLRDADDGVLVLGATNINTNGQIDLSSPTYISKKKYEESPEIKLVGGEILIVKVGATIGKVGIVPDGFVESTINPNLMLTRSKKENSHYFHYLFNSKVMQEAIGLEKMAGAQDAINQEFISSMRILVPSAEEQQAVVDYLDRETARIDSLIGRINQAIEKLQEYRSAVITSAVTGKIDLRGETVRHE